MSAVEQLESGVTELRNAGYRRMRATAVLAANSSYVRELNDKSLNKALEELERVNYDMGRVDAGHLEVLYAHFDDAVTHEITSEFFFVPKFGNVTDHGGCVAHCDLCGKGDSLDERDNEDKIRYTFKLSNTSGGTTIEVGSTCILQHGIHVTGARTAKEAEKIIQQTLRQHIAQWKIERWRAQHPDHHKIVDQYEELRTLRFRPADADYWSLLGYDAIDMGRIRMALVRPFRTASRYYMRHGYLTKKKMRTWEHAKDLLLIAHWGLPLIRRAQELPEDQAVDFLVDKRNKMERVRSRQRVKVA